MKKEKWHKEDFEWWKRYRDDGKVSERLYKEVLELVELDETYKRY